MVKVYITDGAKQKFDLLNGVKKQLDAFFNTMSEDKFSVGEMTKILEDPEIFSKRIATLYVLFQRESDKKWTIIDFLTPSEYSEKFGRH